MGFNRRKMDDERRREAEKQAAAKRALDPQVRADALRFVTEWNERQAQRAPTRVRRFVYNPIAPGCPLSDDALRAWGDYCAQWSFGRSCGANASWLCI